MKLSIRLLPLLFLLMVIVAPITTQAATDTLRRYDSKDIPMSYRQPDIIQQAARFDLQAPGRLISVRVMLGGKASLEGKATLHIFGNEGGSPVPVLETDLISAITITKHTSGNEWVEVLIPGGGIELTGRQFFIVVSGLTDGVKLLTDNTIQAPHCTSVTGGTFWSQAIKHKDGRWEHGSFGYFIEPVIETTQNSANAAGTTGFIRDTAALITSDTEKSKITSTRNFTGISAGDINRDGFTDLMSNGRLFLNNTHGQLTDISQKAGLPVITTSQVFLDIDTDGDLDILALLPGDHTQSLLLINNGKGEFTPLNMTLPVSLDYASGISIGDVNNDEYPDLLIGQMLPLNNNDSLETQNFAPLLLVNTGSYTFIDRSSVLQLKTTEGKGGATAHYTRGTSMLDLNRDGLLDLYISNSFGYPDELYYNLGNTVFDRIEGPSTTEGSNIGLASGCQWVDTDNNGTLDITSPQIVKAHMKRSMPEAQTSIHANAVITPLKEQQQKPLATAENNQVNFEEYHSGCAWGDIDNSGTLDCILTTSCDCRYASLYMQGSNRRLEDSTMSQGMSNIAAGQDGLWADLDNDGDLDFMSWGDQDIVVYKNMAKAKGNYVELDLEALIAHQPMGSTVTVYAGNSMYTRDVIYGRGLSIQDPLRLHIGIGDNPLVDSVAVRWPGSPVEEVFNGPAVNTISAIKQGSGTPRLMQESPVSTSITAYPNPFSNEVYFSISSAQESHATLSIYNARGEFVITLFDGMVAMGTERIRWNGHTKIGSKVANGSYIYRLRLGTQETSGRVVLAD